MPLVVKNGVAEGFDSIEDMFLKELDVPDGVVRIGKNAFEGCKALRRVRLPASVKEIGFCAFRECSSLEEVDLSDGLEVIGSYAFNECKALRSIVLPDTVRKICKVAFMNCKELTEISIPEGVTEIGDCAFAGCNNLRSVDLPLSLRKIDDSAFRLCSQLRLELASLQNLQEIGSEAFRWCSSLREITIPASVKKIGNRLFGIIDSIEIHLLPAELPEMGDEALYLRRTYLRESGENDSHILYVHHLPIEKLGLDEETMRYAMRGFLIMLAEGTDMKADALEMNKELFRENSLEFRQLYIDNNEMLALVCKHCLIAEKYLPQLIEIVSGNVEKTALLLEYSSKFGGAEDYQL